MNFAILIFTLLATVKFYNYHGIVSDPMGKLAFMVGALACIVIGALQSRNQEVAQYPRRAFAMLIAGYLVSIPMASLFHPQPLVTSIITTMPYLLAYLSFYGIMRLDISTEHIIKAYFVLCLISTCVFVANFVTFPNNIFGEPMLYEDTSRGIVRIALVFSEVFPLMVFYAIGKWLETRRVIYLVIMFYFVLFIILSVVRQAILLTILLSTWYLLRRTSWVLRCLALVAIGASVYYALTQIPMFQAMVELTEKQKEENDDKENIRITSWRYYTYDNQTNALTWILGNGMPALGKSTWGTQFDNETSEYGTFSADVGWAGLYWHFGLLAVVGLVYMIVKALLRPKIPQMQFLNYWLVYMIITTFASGIPLYYNQIFNLMVILSMAYRAPEIVSETKPTAELATDPMPTWLPRLPQLWRKAD